MSNLALPIALRDDGFTMSVLHADDAEGLLYLGDEYSIYVLHMISPSMADSLLVSTNRPEPSKRALQRRKCHQYQGAGSCCVKASASRREGGEHTSKSLNTKAG